MMFDRHIRDERLGLLVRREWRETGKEGGGGG